MVNNYQEKVEQQQGDNHVQKNSRKISKQIKKQFIKCILVDKISILKTCNNLTIDLCTGRNILFNYLKKGSKQKQVIVETIIQISLLDPISKNTTQFLLQKKASGQVFMENGKISTVTQVALAHLTNQQLNEQINVQVQEFSRIQTQPKLKYLLGQVVIGLLLTCNKAMRSLNQQQSLLVDTIRNNNQLMNSQNRVQSREQNNIMEGIVEQLPI